MKSIVSFLVSSSPETFVKENRLFGGGAIVVRVSQQDANVCVRACGPEAFRYMKRSELQFPRVQRQRWHVFFGAKIVFVFNDGGSS